MGPRSGLRAAPEMAESRIASQVSLRHHAQMLHSHSPQKSITLRGLCPPIVWLGRALFLAKHPITVKLHIMGTAKRHTCIVTLDRVTVPDLKMVLSTYIVYTCVLFGVRDGLPRGVALCR